MRSYSITMKGAPDSSVPTSILGEEKLERDGLVELLVPRRDDQPHPSATRR